MKDTSRRQLLDLVSQRPHTVAELAAALELTRNAIVVQLRQLEAEGLVRRGTLLRSGNAGKPGYAYEIVPGTEDRLSLAYRPLMEQLVAVLGRRLPPAQLAALLEEAGRELARSGGFSSTTDGRQRLREAVAAVNGLGACARVIEDATGALIVENYRCPFASAVRKDACVCRAAAAFFQEATGLPFTQKCDRSGSLTCRYVAKVAEVSEA